MKINTVLGQIDSKDLGFTLIHEHVINIDWCWVRTFPDLYDKEETVKQFCEDAKELKAHGVNTFVDATPISLGRDISLFRECAERAEINFIACTGTYHVEEPFYHIAVTPERLAELLIREYEHGMEGTDAKPAFLKCGSMNNNVDSKNNAAMLKATCIAHKATGLPIYTHTDPFHPTGLWQKKIFEEEGIDLRNVAFGHSFGIANQYNDELYNAGSFVACDQLSFTPDDRIDIVAQKLVSAINAGRIDQIFISTDTAIRSDYGCALYKERDNRDKNVMVKNHARTHAIFEMIIPALKSHGITDDQLNNIFIDNPRRYLESRF